MCQSLEIRRRRLNVPEMALDLLSAVTAAPIDRPSVCSLQPVLGELLVANSGLTLALSVDVRLSRKPPRTSEYCL